MLESILQQYGLAGEPAPLVIPLQEGLINTTWKLVKGETSFIVQKINQEVFRHPEDIDNNIALIAQHLENACPDYFFAAPIATPDGRSMVHDPVQGYFRVFPFVKGSHSKNIVQAPEEAYEAARQFGQFTAVLRDFDSSRLVATIPAFHDLGLRYQQFERAVRLGNQERVKETASMIRQLRSNSHIVDDYKRIQKDPSCRLRVTHHDTKISNVLFDAHNKGICVIDLDTVMPGYFISDVGDMMRTYLCPVSEEEADTAKIEVRRAFYEAIAEGYLSVMADELTATEKHYFLYAGKFMIYMQALRFLADYLSNDVYYQSSYPGQNLVRAGNQAVLLDQLSDMEVSLRSAV
ncbi:phosphotransferase enzyme family protein [Sediminibacterium soli]|uniref:phosphotransferase enzyme family protein n=1 Tax=Sediminibacterium soli TaxID=2698829 RepID=UPI00137B0BDE|nr:aminoglycoside phosphotransferase family protein [Sediminibacterium soli]NCI46528.1 aminoglycoside phosphotransferase family protein [Sediminibacterium soli]